MSSRPATGRLHRRARRRGAGPSPLTLAARPAALERRRPGRRLDAGPPGRNSVEIGGFRIRICGNGKRMSSTTRQRRVDRHSTVTDGTHDPPADPGEARVHHALPARPDGARAAARHRRRHDGRPEARAHRGGVELGAARLRRERRRHVDVTYELHPDRLGIQVVDDGDGFDPDARAGARERGASEGGLGIAIIRTIADEFEIDSKPGERGSRCASSSCLA